MSPLATVIGYPIIYPGTSTPRVGLLMRLAPSYVKVTLATAYVASIDIVHFLLTPRFVFFVKVFVSPPAVPSYETYSSGH